MKKLLIVMIFFSLMLSGCAGKEAAVPTLLEPVSSGVDTAVVSRGDIYELTTYDANVYPEIQEAYFTIDGLIKELAVYPGQEVKKGDVIAYLDDESLTEELNSRKNELEYTKKNNEYNNREQSLDIQIMELTIKKMKLEQAARIDIAAKEAELKEMKLAQEQTVKLCELQLAQAERKIDDIQVELDKMQLVAPCSGSIAYVKDVGIGSRVNAYDRIVMIADASKLHIQGDYIEARTIQTASQVYAVIHGTEYEIEYIPLELKEILELADSGTIETKYNFTADDTVKSGDYACICVKDKLKTDVLTVPNKALFKDTEGTFVYRMIDGQLERCSVETGTKTDIQVEITGGLSEGDVVYVQE